MPTLGELGRDDTDRSDELAPFWTASAELKRRVMNFGHSGTEAVRAIKTTELRHLVQDAGMPLRIDPSFGGLLRDGEPRIIAAKTVNSRITGTGIHCSVFHRDA